VIEKLHAKPHPILVRNKAAPRDQATSNVLQQTVQYIEQSAKR